MTDATYFDQSTTAPREDAAPVRLPAPQPFGAPVLIHDCVTPLAGETLLSLLLKRMMRDDQP